MLLRFKKSEVQVLLAHTRTAASHKMPYRDVPVPMPGLFLVGDEGIYLMSNGTPFLLADGTQGNPTSSALKVKTVYAEECNPEMMALEDWWEVKQESFGGDDGVEFLTVEDVEIGMDFDADYWVIEMDADTDEFHVLYKVST